MVIDTSVVVAILWLEPEAEQFLRRIAAAEICIISTVSVFEGAMVLARTLGGSAGWSPLDAFLDESEIDVVAFDRGQAQRARDAFVRFGKGRHPAGLNLGDCVA